MKRLWSLLFLALTAAPLSAQAPPPYNARLTPSPVNALPPVPAAPSEPTGALPFLACYAATPADTGTLASTRDFSNFIGFISNPLQNIDPRALTQIQPIFGSAWFSTSSALPGGDMQVYGPAISVAVNDRLGVGLNQGGYVVAHIDRADPRRPLLNRIASNRGQEFGGTREGFLNMGGFAQYTLIQDVEDQFLLTAGMRVVVPCGSYEVFQGKGPVVLSPYLTAGKEFGNAHVLATGGYQFPAGSGGNGLSLFYLNGHIDYQLFGWLYPLVEANWSYHTIERDLPTLETRNGFLSFGNFESTGNIVTVAAGVNAVLIRDRLELGAVYVTKVASQRDFDLDALIVKMTIRY